MPAYRIRGRQAVSLPLPACPGRQDASGLPPAFSYTSNRGSCTPGRPGAKGEGSTGGGGWMLLVSGGAGFIGSNLVAGLNEAGRTDIVVNDALGNAGKWRNLGKRQLADVVPPGELIGWLDRPKLEAVLD